MNASLGWIIFLYAFSFFITVYLFIYSALRRKVSPGAGQFALIVLVEGIWTFGNICEVLATTLNRRLFWDNVQWLPTVLTGVFVLWFALDFTRVHPRWIRRINAVAGLVGLLLASIQLVPLFATGARPGAELVRWDGFESLSYPFLLIDYIVVAYQYFLMLLALARLIYWGTRQPGIYKGQAAVILTGLLMPILGASYGFFNEGVGPQRDLSPVAFAVGNTILAIGLFRWQLFNMMHAARETAVVHMLDPLVVLDSENRISDMNPSAQKLFGCTIREVLGKNAGQVLPAAVPIHHCSESVECEDEVCLDTPTSAGEMEQRFYEVGVLPVYDRLGQLSGRILVLHDITSRKRNEEIQRQMNEERVLRQSEEKFHTTIRQLGEGFLLIDTEGRVAEWNAAMAKITGIPTEEALGQFHWVLMERLTVPERKTPECTEYYRQAIMGTIQTGQLAGKARPLAETEIMTAGGERRTIQQAVFPIRMSEENWIASLTRDITEQKQAHQSMEHYAARMAILHGIDRAILKANSPEDLCETALRGLQQLVPYQQAGLALVNAQAHAPIWLVQRGPDSKNRPMPEQLSGWVDAFQHHPELMDLPKVREDQRVLALRSQNQLIGILYLQLADEKRYSREMEEVVHELSAQLAVALHHAELLEQAQRRVRELTGLHELAFRLNQYVRGPQAAGVLADEIARLTGATRAAVILFDEETGMVRVSRPAFGFTDADVSGMDGVLPQFVERYAEWTEDWVHISTPTDQHPLAAWLRERIEYKNALGSPLIFEGRFLGGVVLADKPGNFNPEDIHLLTVISSQLAAVILNMRLYDQLSAAYEATIAGWSKALEQRDKETQGHSERVTGLSVALAARFGIEGEELQHFKRGVLLHDIGKMSIPDSILLKDSALTNVEWAVMREHPNRAADMLSTIDYLRPSLVVPYSHHERWDGSGYPNGLKGEEIPLWARLFAVVDVWDALTNDRPYRPAWSHEKTIAYLRENAGVLFDPQVVEVFLQLLGCEKA